MVDPVSVTAETKGLLGVKVEDLDGLVDGSRGKRPAIEMDGQHAVGVALKSVEALPGLPVPDLDRLVETSADELGIVKL